MPSRTKNQIKEGFRRLGILIGMLFGTIGGLVGLPVFAHHTDLHWLLVGLVFGTALLLFFVGYFLGRMVGWVAASLFGSS